MLGRPRSLGDAATKRSEDPSAWGAVSTSRGSADFAMHLIANRCSRFTSSFPGLRRSNVPRGTFRSAYRTSRISDTSSLLAMWLPRPAVDPDLFRSLRLYVPRGTIRPSARNTTLIEVWLVQGRAGIQYLPEDHFLSYMRWPTAIEHQSSARESCSADLITTALIPTYPLRNQHLPPHLRSLAQLFLGKTSAPEIAPVAALPGKV